MDVHDFLRIRKIPFEIIEHDPAYTAQEMAQRLDISGYKVAKTVLLRSGRDGEYAVAVLPAAQKVDPVRLSKALGWDHAELATEAEIAEHFADCETGALPPFGSKYNIRTVIDESLMHADEIVFEGITHRESIRMKLHDYQEVEHPAVARFATTA